MQSFFLYGSTSFTIIKIRIQKLPTYFILILFGIYIHNYYYKYVWYGIRSNIVHIISNETIEMELEFDDHKAMVLIDKYCPLVSKSS